MWSPSTIFHGTTVRPIQYRHSKPKGLCLDPAPHLTPSPSFCGETTAMIVLRNSRALTHQSKHLILVGQWIQSPHSILWVSVILASPLQRVDVMLSPVTSWIAWRSHTANHHEPSTPRPKSRGCLFSDIICSS